MIRLRNEYYLQWSGVKRPCFFQLQHRIDGQSASIKSPDLYILRGRTCCLLIKPVCGSRMFHFLLEIALSNAGCLSWSPGKELQQHGVLMLSTQINLRPSLTAFLSSSRAYLFALNCGHLSSEAHWLSSRGSCVWVERYICSALLQLCVEYERGCSFFEREYVFRILYVSVCADENEKWALGRTGLWGGQAVPGHSFFLAPCLINGPRSYTLLHQRVCHSLIMWPSEAQLMTLEE